MKIKNSYVEQPPEEQFDKKVQGTFIGDKHTKWGEIVGDINNQSDLKELILNLNAGTITHVNELSDLCKELSVGVVRLSKDLTELGDSIPQIQEEIVDSIKPMLEDVTAQIKDEIKPSLDRKAEALWYDEFNQVENSDKSYWYVCTNASVLGEDYEVVFNYLVKDSEGNPIPYDFGKGGGGGSSDDTSVKVTIVDWPATIALGTECIIKINWTSTKDEMPTGPGSLAVLVDGKQVILRNNVPQGNVEFDLTNYIESGTHRVEVRATDAYDTQGRLVSMITAIAVSITSKFDANRVLSDRFNYIYTPIGNTLKIVHFIVDGEEVATDEVLISNEQQTHQFSGWSHGSHTLKVYFTCDIEGNEVKSNELYYDLMYAKRGVTTPIITSTFLEFKQEQFNPFIIPYRVYTPNYNNSDIELIVDGEVVKTLSVNQDTQYWEIMPTETGSHKYEIRTKDIVKSFVVNIASSAVNVQAVTQDLELYMSTFGRSNAEENPSLWEDKQHNIKATLTGFNFVTDGWQQDAEMSTVLRLAGDARAYIPFEIFSKDFKLAGKTIEIEFATSNVRNYDSTIISCHDGLKGISISSQLARFNSEASELQTQFKEDEHIRLSFVIEKNVETRLIFIYINGIMSGTVQYPVTDNFRQLTPVGISLGSNDATLDIYNIRVYDNNLDRKQIVNNWIADTQSGSLKYNRYLRNSNYNEAGAITIDLLPSDLPYVVFGIKDLPTYKGDKKTAPSVTFKDPVNHSRSYNATDVQMDVQGTSSQYYFRKNFKLKYKKGFNMEDGSYLEKFPVTIGGIGESTFTYKADVASSEGANNVELVRYFEDSKPWDTPAEQENSLVRVGIDGFPMVAFHDDGTSTSFYGKMNFNNDKGTPKLFGFKTYFDDNGNYIDGDESWEMANNTTDLVLFKSDDLTNWKDSFESRFPDDNTPDEHTFGNNPGELDRLQDMVSWVVSTRRLETDSEEEKAAKLQKFRNELEDRFNLESTLFYYLFTELFLMVDSRAKNAFPTYYKSRKAGDGGDRWFWIPYDMDTAIGINNEGLLVFGYELEDIDLVHGAYVYNGQDSTMWANVRDAFTNELAEMYSNLRSGNYNKVAWNYDSIEKRFEEHQDKWSETIFNEDAYFKYIVPLRDDNDASYLSMLQGSKEEQRKWWLYNRFKYLDSKYVTGDAKDSYIMLRAYQKSDFNITPYANIYVAAAFDNQMVTERAKKDITYLVQSPATWDPAGTDSVVSIYSADQLKDIGDISAFKVGYANFSAADKLERIIVGSTAEGFVNEKLEEINVGSNDMLRLLDVRNCVNLKQTIDLSNCKNIETIYADNTQTTGVLLPNGGGLKTLHLPDTITSLTIRNQPSLVDLQLEGTSKIQRLWLENIPMNLINAQEVITSMPQGAAIRLIDFKLEVEDVQEIYNLYDLLDTMTGINAQGEDTDKAAVNGKIFIDTITYADWKALSDRYLDVKIIANVIMCHVEFYNDNVLYFNIDVQQGTDLTSMMPENPEKAATVEHYYIFENWNPNEFSNIQTDMRYDAVYSEHIQVYDVHFDKQTSLPTVPEVQQLIQVEYGNLVPNQEISIEGTIFRGWFLEPECINLFDFNTPIAQNYYLYAGWIDEEAPSQVLLTRLAYNKFKAEIHDNIAVTRYAITTTPDTPIEWVDIESPTTDFTFEHEIDNFGTYYVWGGDAAGLVTSNSITAFEIRQNVADGAELIVSSNEQDNIKYALQGSEVTVSADIDSHYDNLEVKVDDVLYEDSTFNILVNDVVTIDVTCTPHIYTVKFDTGDIEVDIPDQQIIYNHLVIRPSNQVVYVNNIPYIAKDWYIKDTNILWNFNSDKVDSDITLVAKWVEYVAPTIIKINVPEDNTSVKCSVYQSLAGATTINWGDSTDEDISDIVGGFSIEHIYEHAGEYFVEITCARGAYYLGANYNAVITPAEYIVDVEFALNLQITGINAFRNAVNLKSVKLTEFMTTVSQMSFQNCTSLESVDFSYNINKLEAQAFEGCTSLSGTIVLPANILEIESSVFFGCSNITGVVLGDNVRSIGNKAFDGCSLTSFNVPRNEYFTSLSANILSNTKIKELIIPANVTEIQGLAFSNCRELEKVVIEGDLDQSKHSADGAFAGCSKLLTAGPAEDGVDYNIIFSWKEVIPRGIFGQSSLQTLILPKTIKKLESYSIFGAQSLTVLGARSDDDDSISISNLTMLEEIQDYALAFVPALVNIDLKDNLKYIGACAFLWCGSLVSVNIPINVLYIGPSAFGECSALTNVNIYTVAYDQTAKVDILEKSWFYGQYGNKNTILHVRSHLTDDVTYELYGDYWNFTLTNSGEQIQLQVVADL